MELVKIRYEDLNSRQKENYNYHKIASALSEYGYDCMRLNNDWQGADFIAVHNDGETFLKVQLKSRFTVDYKYKGKDIYIAFIDEGKCSIFNHDEALEILPNNITNSVSWEKNGKYTWNKTPNRYKEIITIL